MQSIQNVNNNVMILHEIEWEKQQIENELQNTKYGCVCVCMWWKWITSRWLESKVATKHAAL